MYVCCNLSLVVRLSPFLPPSLSLCPSPPLSLALSFFYLVYVSISVRLFLSVFKFFIHSLKNILNPPLLKNFSLSKMAIQQRQVYDSSMWYGIYVSNNFHRSLTGKKNGNGEEKREWCSHSVITLDELN